MKKTILSPERVLQTVQASSSFEGLYPTQRSNELGHAYLRGEITGADALKQIWDSYPQKRTTK